MSDTYIPAKLRSEVIERDKNCCEYCRLSQDDNFFTFHVDHIISEKHDGKTQLDNLCLSCPNCNIRKGSDIAGADPVTGNATFLYHPRKQDWDTHFIIEDGKILAKSPESRVTIYLLHLNIPERIAERRLLIELQRYPC
ncbi:MAG: HNH endonuclease signature motif containing protein [Phototrophicaceae bacterium]